MAKPLHRFGGWLKFFNLSLWFAAIFMTGTTILLTVSIFKSESVFEFSAYLISIFDGVVSIVLNILILKIMKKKSIDTPSKMVKLMAYLVGFSALFVICLIMLYSLVLKMDAAAPVAEEGKGIFSVIIWFLIWSSYFKKSKRVFSYYSKNVENSMSVPKLRVSKMVFSSDKEKIAAGLLAILLGIFGFHKFYLGYIKQGVIVLFISIFVGVCTLGLASIVMLLIGIVEGAVYLSKSQEEFNKSYVQNRRNWF